MNEKTKLVNRRIELAQADPPALFVLSQDAKAEDLDAALRIISCLPPVGADAPGGPPSSRSPK